MHVSHRQDELASKGEQPKPCKPRALPNVEQHGAYYYVLQTRDRPVGLVLESVFLGTFHSPCATQGSCAADCEVIEGTGRNEGSLTLGSAAVLSSLLRLRVAPGPADVC